MNFLLKDIFGTKVDAFVSRQKPNKQKTIDSIIIRCLFVCEYQPSFSCKPGNECT